MRQFALVAGFFVALLAQGAGGTGNYFALGEENRMSGSELWQGWCVKLGEVAFAEGVCRGYIRGVLELANEFPEIGKSWNSCPPPNLDDLRASILFKDWATLYPGKLSGNASRDVFVALANKYPCQ